MNLDPDPAYLNTLPPEVILKIIQDLPAREITSLCQSSQYLNSFCSDWNLWEKKAFADFAFPRNLFKQTTLQLPFQRYLQVRAYSYNPDQYLVAAARSGQTQLVDYLLRSGGHQARTIIDALVAAAANGNNEVVKRLIGVLDFPGPGPEPENERELDAYYREVESWLVWLQESNILDDTSIENLLEDNSVNNLIGEILAPAIDAANANNHPNIAHELEEIYLGPMI
jgi:hypothetical protein